jgi:hypothetical protein
MLKSAGSAVPPVVYRLVNLTCSRPPRTDRDVRDLLLLFPLNLLATQEPSPTRMVRGLDLASPPWCALLLRGRRQT